MITANLSGSTVESLKNKLEDDQMTLISDVVKISQTPAPTFDEEERAELMASLFEEYGVDVVDRDEAGNVIAKVQEKEVPARCLVAHLDTVFDRSVDHTVHLDDEIIQGPGVGDDSLALATLLSVLRNLPREDLGNLILVATTGTEGDGNLRGSRHFVENFDEELGFTLCLEGHRQGRIDHRSLGTRRMHISVDSQGGHVWRDDTGENPIGVLGEIIARIRDMDSAPKEDPDAMVNLGKIEGGSAYNTVPYESDLHVEARSSSEPGLEKLSREIDRIVDEVEQTTSVEISFEDVTKRPVSGIPENHWLVETAKTVHKQIGISSQPGAASSDSSVFLAEGVPTLTLGLARGANKHRPDELISIDSLTDGQLQVLMMLIEAGKKA